MKTFETLESRYIFTGALVLKEAMHVGSGEGDERADSLFTRSNGKFYIPGSSLRGALRSAVERIACALGKNTCLLFDGSSSNTCVTSKPELIKNEKETVEKGGGKWDEKKACDFLQGNLCDTCKVFGSTHFASKVKITDLYPKKNSVPKDAVRCGVGIDRDTETASEGALFEIEVVEKDCQFDFELIAENLDGKEEWGLLCLGLWEMMRKKEEGGAFYIGAKSAAGLGRCELNLQKIEYFDNAKPWGLREYLQGELKCESDKDFVKKKVKEYLELSGGVIHA
ncbi:CRISPR-associated RAMP protein [bacterium]|nr:CRISPR-associated RAMP protein [bacterium]MBU1613925.1 CRISPR-associated RAMP protein [bacterium]